MDRKRMEPHAGRGDKGGCPLHRRESGGRPVMSIRIQFPGFWDFRGICRRRCDGEFGHEEGRGASQFARREYADPQSSKRSLAVRMMCFRTRAFSSGVASEVIIQFPNPPGSAFAGAPRQHFFVQAFLAASSGSRQRRSFPLPFANFLAGGFGGFVRLPQRPCLLPQGQQQPALSSRRSVKRLGR